ncbi:MAG: DUF6263 family protein [Planctomycetota bacterium]|nr:DUF6263 family protein [Planctomycetota bacterium]
MIIRYGTLKPINQECSRTFTTGRYRQVIGGVLALLVSLTFAQKLTAQRKLVFQYQTGSENVLSVKTDTEILMKYMGQDIRTAMQMETGISQYIDSVSSDGMATITQKLIGLKMAVEGGPLGVKLVYDSAQAENNEASLSGILKPLVGAEFEIVVSRLGKVHDFKPPTDLLATLAKQPGSQTLGQMFTPDGFRQMASQGSLTFPDKALREGDQWQDSITLKAAQFGETEVKLQYTYQGLVEVDGKPLDKIGIQMTTLVKPLKNPTGSQLKIREQSSQGTLYFDNQRGQLDHSSLKQQMTTEVIVGQNSIVQTITTNVTTSLK